jgi:hypothetical protein
MEGTMSTVATGNTAAVGTEIRILREGYGDGAWHGPDLKAALADVAEATAFWRPAAGRHNIAEIALHHAFYAHAVRAKLSEVEPEPFVLGGDDWFPLADSSTMKWSKILDVVALEQQRLADCVCEINAGRKRSPLPASERFDVVLGITCHAIYHAGQIQLLKRLAAS